MPLYVVSVTLKKGYEMNTKPQDPRFDQLELAKQELRQEQQKYPQDELMTHDGLWDDIEQVWYDLIDDYDVSDLNAWGVQPT